MIPQFGRGGLTGSGVNLISGVLDPSVSGAVATRPALYVRTSEYLPKSVSKVNEIFATWGAGFSHGYDFQEASGNCLDMAPSGGLDLVPANSPTQNVSTSLTDYVTDKAIQFATGSSNHISPTAAASYDVTTGSLVILLTVQLTNNPASVANIVGKFDVAGNHYLLYMTAAGNLVFQATDGTLTPAATIAVDHHGTAYLDILAVLDRDSASKTIALASTLGSDTQSATGLATITTAAKMTVGNDGTHVSPDMIVTFLALGTTPGTLSANRVAALAAYSSARIVGTQLWGLRGTTSTSWSKVGP